MTVPIAHAGHWLASVAYAAPVLALLALIGVGKLRERRHPTPNAHDEDRA